MKVPAAGTENDDHNPPRIAPRNLFDLSVGDDNLFNGDKHKWSLRLTAINLTNKEALYNFISTFSGTHYVTPRALYGRTGVPLLTWSAVAAATAFRLLALRRRHTTKAVAAAALQGASRMTI